jgi:pSer/pThr/pTyr-binding forkhead associated (FHA) protein
LTSDEDATAEPDSESELTSTLSIGVPDVEVADGPAADPDQAAVEALPAGSALLVVRRGPNAGSRFGLDVDLVTAGRHPESDIFLDDVTVSRRHAQFVRIEGGYLVKDVGSLNGTYVNRQRIDEAVLSGGDEVQIGKYRLVYLSGPAGGGGRS